MATGLIKTADAGERTNALRRARINSVFVRVMRWLLPAVAVLLLSSYALFMQRTLKVETATHAGKLNTGTVSTAFDNLAMSNPSYEGYNKKDGSQYRVKAKTAITDLSRDKPIELIEIDGSFVQKNGSKTTVKARRGMYDQTAGKLNLDGGINVAAPNGMNVTLNSAVFDTKTSEILSNEPVLVEMPNGEVRGNSMHLDQRARAVIFNDGVAARIRPSDGKANTRLPGASTAGTGGSVLGFGGDGSNAPVDITAVRLALSDKPRVATFKGQVRAQQDGRTLEAPELIVSFANAAPLAGLGSNPAQPAVASPATQPPRGRLQRISARNGVKLSQASNVVHAQTADFDVAGNQAQLSGDVRITGGANREITAKLATIDTISRRVVLSGNVIASQTDSLLRGNRMIYEPKLGRMRLSSPAIGGTPKGKIFVRFKAPQGKQKRKGWQPRQANAQRRGGFTTNPNAPIEITARALDVRDQRSVARFDGNVRARQGDLRLSTPKLTAMYIGRIGLFAPDNAKRTKQPAMKLRYIRASKPVTVTSGDDTKATGERAEFDLLANKVTLAGNVILQQGRQIIRGERLIIDLKTGRSRMKNAAPDKNTAESLTLGAAPRITANRKRRDCGGQMCGVFYPQDAQKRRGKRKPLALGARPTSPRKPKVDSGWSASTTTN